MDDNMGYPHVRKPPYTIYSIDYYSLVTIDSMTIDRNYELLIVLSYIKHPPNETMV